MLAAQAVDEHRKSQHIVHKKGIHVFNWFCTGDDAIADVLNRHAVDSPGTTGKNSVSRTPPRVTPLVLQDNVFLFWFFCFLYFILVLNVNISFTVSGVGGIPSRQPYHNRQQVPGATAIPLPHPIRARYGRPPFPDGGSPRAQGPVHKRPHSARRYAGAQPRSAWERVCQAGLGLCTWAQRTTGEFPDWPFVRYRIVASSVTPKIIYFYQLKKHFLLQSIKKKLYFILKTVALALA